MRRYFGGLSIPIGKGNGLHAFVGTSASVRAGKRNSLSTMLVIVGCLYVGIFENASVAWGLFFAYVVLTILTAAWRGWLVGRRSSGEPQ